MPEPEIGAFGAKTVAIIGAGTAGRAFALRCARAGLTVVLEDVMPSKLRRAQDEYADFAAGLAGEIRYAATVEDAVADADIAIDFVPDELESKLEIFSLLDRMAPPRTVLCTPTENLSITDLASCTYRAERCVGIRWRGNSTEVVRSKFLNSFAEALVLEFLVRAGCNPRVIDDASEPMLIKNVSASTLAESAEND